VWIVSSGRLAGLLFLGFGAAAALEQPRILADCASIADNSLRLACFDRLAADSASRNPIESRNRPSATAGVEGTGITAQASPAPQTGTEKPAASLLAEHWETDPDRKRGIFAFRPHQENYVLFAKYSTAPNDAPFRPFSALVPQEQGLKKTELAFQLGFKTKLLEDVSAKHADLWFGYTQRSFWQAYSHRASSPFRETDYQPELMAVMPVDFKLLGMQARFINVGFSHQSNGQLSTLSRSWNRVYVQAGWERGGFSLLTRVWKRIGEDRANDDNPDIIDYMGHGDIVATYRANGHQVSLLARRNFRTSKGAMQLGWAFPLAGRLKGYVQLFSGYGQSLIDYNASQTTVGLGVLLDY
jgi:phospholipase A1